MEKKESLSKLDSTFQVKKAGFSGKTFGIIKFILGIFLLPFVYSTTTSFINEFRIVNLSIQNYFWAGIVSFTVIYLFIYEPVKIYQKGQKILEIIFSFFKPLVRFAPYLFPIYTIIIFALYLVFSLFSKNLINYFIFLLGFSFALHIIFSARTMRSKQQDFFRTNYIFGFSFAYIINLLLIAFCFNLISLEFSFVNFINNFFQNGYSIFSALFKQLFL